MKEGNYQPSIVGYERDRIPILSADSYPNTIQDDALVERLDAIRRVSPVVKFEGNPAIHILGWAEVGEMYRNWPVFSSELKHDSQGYKSSELPLIPAGYDPPRAHLYKQFLQRKYQPEDAEAFEPIARARAAQLIVGFASQGECEYMEDFAARYFGPILLDYVGIPAEQVERVQQLEMDTFRTAENDADGSIRANAARELSSLLVNLVKRSRAELPSPDERTDSLLTFMLTEPMGDGTLMSDDEIKAALHIMCLGGAHSVKAAIGYTMKLLADRPALREQILADGQAGPNMIDELLRWNGVGGGMSFRTVAADTEIAGCPLHKGDTVCAMLTAANHDPKAAEDAGEIRFDRSTVKSFTFAFGTHRCLGINFAKMGVRVAVEEWLKRIPNFRVGNDEGNDEQTWAGVGYLALPLRWT